MYANQIEFVFTKTDANVYYEVNEMMINLNKLAHARTCICHNTK